MSADHAELGTKTVAARRGGARSRTTSTRQLTKTKLALGRQQYPVEDHGRPTTRAACATTERPCPFVSCRYHLCLDVKLNGSIKLNFPDVELSEIPSTCALDVADRGGVTLQEVGAFLNLTRERTRQLERLALSKLHRNLEVLRMHEYLEEHVDPECAAQSGGGR